MAASEKPKVDLRQVSDFDIQCLMIERDACQFRAQQIDALLNEIGSQKGYVDTAKKEGPAGISEEPFNSLSYEDGRSDRGPYQVARLPLNNNAKFQSCINILKQNITATDHTFSEKSWENFYWLSSEDGNAIFRRKKKVEKTEKIHSLTQISEEDVKEILNFLQDLAEHLEGLAKQVKFKHGALKKTYTPLEPEKNDLPTRR